MTRLPSRIARPRYGVTLIELLVVILIMLMITAVTVPAIAPALEGRKIREAARIVEVFLNGARNRALSSGNPVGVFIEPDTREPSQCIQLSYAEQPDPYSGDFQNSTICLLGNGGFGSWSSQPHYDNTMPTPNFIGGVVNTTAPVFPQGDVGWIENFSPGDTFYLNNDDTVMYRFYAGEPYIDGNGNGQYDTGELFNDVDGSTTYTPPNNTYIDQASGAFTSFPQIIYGAQTAFITYTYADPLTAADHMSVTGAYGATPMPIYLSLTSINEAAANFIYPAATNNSGAGPDQTFAFTFVRRPIRTSSTVANLPAGTCIDLGSNYVDSATGNIVGVPGSGLDMFVPFSGGSSTLGFFATFRPNPLADHEIIGQPAATAIANRPLMIIFNPSGSVDYVYSFDERSFITNTSQSNQPLNLTNYQARNALTPIYLLIGRQELVDGDPQRIASLSDGTAPGLPIFNLQDPDSIWLSINPRTGLVTSTENVAPDLTQPAPNTQTPANPRIQLYLNAQTYQARSLAREASDMGGR